MMVNCEKSETIAPDYDEEEDFWVYAIHRSRRKAHAVSYFHAKRIKEPKQKVDLTKINNGTKQCNTQHDSNEK